MKAVFPGKPQAKLQAFTTALWEGQRILAYISHNALIILRGPNDLVQTTTHAETEVLEAVAICETSGKIATCTSSTIFVYSPFGHDFESLKWSLQHTLTPACADPSLACLCWGLPEEVLVAGSSLTLFIASQTTRETWTKNLANHAKLVAFTPDANFLATTGDHDRLVKIWSRQFLGGEYEEERFDVSYLAHPAAVTSLRWHRRPDQDHHADTVLYTTCGDSKLRIWAATDHHALQPLQLWTELDLNDCILPRNPLSPPAMAPRYIFILDGWEFEAMVEDAIHQAAGGEREKHTREHLSDVAYRNPDVCVVMDDCGNMSAWGLERIGCKAREPNDIFNIVLAEGLNMKIPEYKNGDGGHVSLCTFTGIKDGKLNVVANMFNGAIEWLSSPVDRFFDTSSSLQRFQTEATWTGHAEPIESLLCSARNTNILSMSPQHEIVAWEQNTTETAFTLSRHSTFMARDTPSQECLLFDDRYVAFAYQSRIDIWDLRTSAAHEAASHLFQRDLTPICLTPVTGNGRNSGDEFLILLTNTTRGTVLQVSYEEKMDLVSIAVFTEFDIPKDFEGHNFRPVRSDAISSSRPILYSFSSSGSLTAWDVELDIMKRKFTMKCRSTTATGVSSPALTCVGAFGKAAVVAATRSSLTVWDLRLGYLELQETFQNHEAIQAVDLVSTPSEGSLLAVALAHKALVYAEDRYDTDIGKAAWTLLRSVDIGERTNVPIADCMWLANYDLLLAAGNQMFLFDSHTEIPEAVFSAIEVSPKQNATATLSAVTAALNSAPAIFNPGLLSQILLSGNTELVNRLLNALREKLKFWTQGDELDSLLGIAPGYMQSKCETLQDEPTFESDQSEGDESAVFSEEAASLLQDILDGIDLPYLSMKQQGTLRSLGESLGAFERHRSSVDSLAFTYLICLHILVKQPPSTRPQIPWSQIAWASHSNSQDAMVDLTSRIYDGRMLWKDAKESGMFMWIGDIEALRAQFEVIGRNEYTKTDEKNPIDCSIYYLALKKKQVLVGLWRMATWNREQASTQRLLANNFSESRWKTVAMKNAYALLGLRRFEYAAAFFLLADCPKDAVNVLVSQLGDMQLAIAVARVYEGDDGPVLKELLQEKVLPRAAREGNKWLATWAFWLLNKKDMAVRALLEPLHDLITLPEAPPMLAKHYSNNEPSLIHLYRLLRDRLHKDPRRNVTIAPKSECDLVMRSAMSYVRGGYFLLALDLVRNWEFKHQVAPKQVNGVSSLPIISKPADETPGSQPAEADLAAKWLEAETPVKPQRKKVTEEPSTASILDNFDF